MAYLSFLFPLPQQRKQTVWLTNLLATLRFLKTSEGFRDIWTETLSLCSSSDLVLWQHSSIGDTLPGTPLTEGFLTWGGKERNTLQTVKGTQFPGDSSQGLGRKVYISSHAQVHPFPNHESKKLESLSQNPGAAWGQAQGCCQWGWFPFPRLEAEICTIRLMVFKRLYNAVIITAYYTIISCYFTYILTLLSALLGLMLLLKKRMTVN